MANTDNFDPKSVKKLTAMEILKRVGPGIIMTGIVIGPGNITTSAMLGANYGYDMIWIIIPIILMAIIFMMVSYEPPPPCGAEPRPMEVVSKPFGL